jgi:hypothetical protein
MILHQHVIQGTRTPVVLAPLGDIQWTGRPEDVAVAHLGEHVTRACSMGALFLGLGDYIDFASPSNRETFRTGRLYETAHNVIEDTAYQLVADLYERVFRPTTGKWLGLVAGHHYYRFRDGSTTDMALARMLETTYWGEAQAVVRLTWQDKTHTQHLDIWLAHGTGSGRSPGSPIQVLDRVSQYIDADIYIMGHQTKRCVATIQRLVPVYPTKGEPRLVHRTLYLVGAGGWMRGYRVGHEALYPEQQMLRPVALGAPLIHIRPRWSGGSWEPQVSVEA